MIVEKRREDPLSIQLVYIGSRNIPVSIWRLILYSESIPIALQMTEEMTTASMLFQILSKK